MKGVAFVSRRFTKEVQPFLSNGKEKGKGVGRSVPVIRNLAFPVIAPVSLLTLIFLTIFAGSGKEIYHFCFVLLCIRGQILSTSPPGGLYLEGRFNGGFFALPVWGAYIWRGLYMEGLIFGILRYLNKFA